MVRLIFGGICLLMALASLLLPDSVPGQERALQDALIFAGIGLPFAIWGAIALKRGTTATPLRWWKVSAARIDLIEGNVAPSAQVQYLFWFLVVEIFSWGLDTTVFKFKWPEEPTAITGLGLGIIVVKLAGPVLAYAANGGRSGQDFLVRFFALSFPIRVRCLVLILVLAIPARVASPLLSGASLFWLCFNILHYLGLIISLRKLHAGSRSEPEPPA